MLMSIDPLGLLPLLYLGWVVYIAYKIHKANQGKINRKP